VNKALKVQQNCVYMKIFNDPNPYSQPLFSAMLKGPKLEIFGSMVFPQIRPVWVADLGLDKKIQNFDGLGLKITVFLLFSAVADIAKHF